MTLSSFRIRKVSKLVHVVVFLLALFDNTATNILPSQQLCPAGAPDDDVA